MKVEGEVPLEEIDARLGGALSTSGPVLYCVNCDGLRPVGHDCICPVSRKSPRECPCCACDLWRQVEHCIEPLKSCPKEEREEARARIQAAIWNHMLRIMNARDALKGE